MHILYLYKATLNRKKTMRVKNEEKREGVIKQEKGESGKKVK